MRISVVIPTFNRAGIVGQAIDSVLAQTTPADEIIVVDDGSTDDTQAALTRYGDKIVALRQANGGVSVARNAGIARAKGEWLTFLDSDDVWLPGRLAILSRDATDPADDAGVHVADLRLEGDGYAESLFAVRGLVAPSTHAERIERPLTRTLSGLSFDSIACRRDLLVRAGGFDPALRMFEDLDLLLRLSLLGPWLFTSEIVCRARRVVEAPGLALTEQAAASAARSRRGHVAILQRLLSHSTLDRTERVTVRRALSGAQLELAEILLQTGETRSALSDFWASVNSHPNPAKAIVKVIASVACGADHRRQMAGRGDGFYREAPVKR